MSRFTTSRPSSSGTRRSTMARPMQRLPPVTRAVARALPLHAGALPPAPTKGMACSMVSQMKRPEGLCCSSTMWATRPAARDHGKAAHHAGGHADLAEHRRQQAPVALMVMARPATLSTALDSVSSARTLSPLSSGSAPAMSAACRHAVYRLVQVVARGGLEAFVVARDLQGLGLGVGRGAAGAEQFSHGADKRAATAGRGALQVFGRAHVDQPRGDGAGREAMLHGRRRRVGDAQVHAAGWRG